MFALITVKENHLSSIDTDGQQLWTLEQSVANQDADAINKYDQVLCIIIVKENRLSPIDADGQQLLT